MAKGRTRSRMELREQHDAAEARERDAQKTDGDAGEEDEDLGDLDVSEEEAPAKAPAKKKKAAPKKTGESKPRKKVNKVVRMRACWVVMDNSNKPVSGGTFEYSKKAEAEALAEKLKADKKQLYFVQPHKEAIQE